MRALRLFASLAAVVLSLTGCSLVLDTDPPDPIVSTDLGGVAFDAGARDLGGHDLGTRDLGAYDEPAVDGGRPIDGGPPVDDGGEMDAGDADAGCSSGADCDDGIFCNGLEECIAGLCVTTPAMCLETDGIDCTRPACDPMLDACVETADSAWCVVGTYCSPVDGCLRTPDCLVNTDCLPADACTAGACIGGTCHFAPIDCATALLPLPAGDCRVPTCDVALGCVYAPVHTRCADLVGCTADVCRTDGTCAHEPRPALCDDGATCTVDTCDPASLCAEVGGGMSGCKHAADNTACVDAVASIVAANPGLACATPVCIGGTARNLSGCGFEGGCASGQQCASTGGGLRACVPPTTTSPCMTAGNCDDGNPCNGAEACYRGTCQPAITSPCSPTPSGPTIDGLCSLSALGPVCALRPDPCLVAVATP